MRKSSLHPHLFMFGGNADEQLLLALAIAHDQPMEDGLPNKITTRDLWELLDEPNAIHPSLNVEWPTARRVGLALARLRERGLVKRSHQDPYMGDRTFCWYLTQTGFELLGKRVLFKPKRRAS